MQVNSVRQNQAQKVNFTSVIPTKVFIDGLPSADPENLKRAVVATTKILTKPYKGNEKFKQIILNFSRVVRDFKYNSEGAKSGEVLRNNINEYGGVFLFSGAQAQKLHKPAKLIGPEKTSGLISHGTVKTFEVHALGTQYGKSINSFINDFKLRLTETIFGRGVSGKVTKGDPLEMHIHAKSIGTFGKRGFKLDIDRISFEKVNKTPQSNSSAQVTKSIEKQLPAQTAISREVKAEPKVTQNTNQSNAAPLPVAKSNKKSSKKTKDDSQLAINFD